MSLSRRLVWVALLLGQALSFAGNGGAQNSDSFCDAFEAGALGWTIAVNDPDVVSSPTHSGSGQALRMHSSHASSDCHSAVYRTGFSGSTGYYSAWAQQQNFAAGMGLFIQVQPGSNPNPYFRDGYHLRVHASNAQPPGTFVFERCRAIGGGYILGSLNANFLMNEWVQLFVRRLPNNTFVFGYERNGVRDSTIVQDPNPPLDAAGAFYLWGCGGGSAQNYFDDVCFMPEPVAPPQLRIVNVWATDILTGGEPVAARPAHLHFQIQNTGDLAYDPADAEFILFWKAMDRCGENLDSRHCTFDNNDRVMGDIVGFRDIEGGIDYPFSPGVIQGHETRSYHLDKEIRFLNPDFDEYLLLRIWQRHLSTPSGGPGWVEDVHFAPLRVEHNILAGFNCVSTVALILAPLNPGAGLLGQLWDGALCAGGIVTSGAGIDGIMIELLLAVDALKQIPPDTQTAGDRLLDAVRKFASAAQTLARTLTKCAGKEVLGKFWAVVLSVPQIIQNELDQNGCTQMIPGIIRAIGAAMGDALRDFWKGSTEWLRENIGQNWTGITLECPADLELTGPLGQRVLATHSGEVFNELESGFQVTAGELKTILGDLLAGPYVVRILGRGHGTAKLGLVAARNEPGALEVIFDNITCTPQSIATLSPIGLTIGSYVISLDLDGDGLTDQKIAPSSTSDSGKIQIVVTTGGVSPETGIGVDVYDAADNLVAELVSGSDGKCETSKLMIGEYQVVILPPLGFMADSESKTVIVDDEVLAGSFDLHAVPMSRSPRTLEYWKHQVRVALEKKGKPQESVTQLRAHMKSIHTHFNDNRLNSIDVFQVEQPATLTDSLKALYALLSGTGRCHPHQNSDERTNRARSKALWHFTALLLNVASGKLSQSAVLSPDGITVSQAITRCYDLLEEDAPCVNDDIDDNDDDLSDEPPDQPWSCFRLAKHIAKRINAGRTLRADVIPTNVANILYRVQGTSPVLPREFSLSQNYPNPFNAGTVISYALAEDAPVRLDIFDILGQRVATVLDETQPSGEHSISWDGRNQQGEAVASGVYFYRLRAGSFVESKKMILVK